MAQHRGPELRGARRSASASSMPLKLSGRDFRTECRRRSRSQTSGARCWHLWQKKAIRCCMCTVAQVASSGALFWHASCRASQALPAGCFTMLASLVLAAVGLAPQPRVSSCRSLACTSFRAGIVTCAAEPPEIDLTGDGGVLKRVLRSGSGELPRDGARVVVCADTYVPGPPYCT